MSIASELTRLQNAKNAITSAIAQKGVTVPSGTKLDGMAALIGQIETGGGGANLGSWSGYVYNNMGSNTAVYYTKSDGTAGHKFTEGDYIDLDDVAPNTYLVVENLNATPFWCTNCDAEATYYISDNDTFAGVFKLTGNNFGIDI